MAEFSVQITEDLVNRLINDDVKLKKTVKKTKTRTPQQVSPRAQTKVNEKQVHDGSELKKGAASQGWPVPAPYFLPVTPPAPAANPELDAIVSVVKESARLEELLKKKEASMAQEVTAKAKELRDKEFKLPNQKPVPCMADYDACQKCYKEHANNIQKCAPLTRSYYVCTRTVKQQVSSADK